VGLFADLRGIRSRGSGATDAALRAPGVESGKLH